MSNRSETNDVFDKLLAQNGMAAAPTSVDAEHVDDAADVTDAADDAADVTDAADDAADVTDAADDAADVTDAADDVTAAPNSDAQLLPRTRNILRRNVISAAIIAFCAVTALAGYFGWQLRQQHQVTAATQAALTAAESYAVTLTTVDNTKIDSNFKQVLDGATGEFKDMYSQSAAQLRQLLIDNKAVSHGTIVDAAIKSATTNKVDVLIFVDQSIANSANPQPRIDRSRIAMTMVNTDGRWLASKVDIK